jgi:hypothetical protein
MDAGGSAQGAASGSGANSGANSGSGYGEQSENQATTTTSSQQQPTSAASSSTSIPSNFSTGPGVNKAAIACEVIGGIAALFLLVFFGYFVLKRRREKRRRSAEPVTYATLNTSMAGVPFNHRNYSGEHQSLVPPQPAFRRDGTEVRGGAYNENEESRLYFLPTYAESQAGVMGNTNSGIVSHRSYAGYESESTIHSAISPITPSDIMSPHGMGSAPFLMPQYTADTMGFPEVASPQPTAASFSRPQRATDTMGFPIDDPAISHLRSTTPASIIAPIPRPLVVHQDSLERIVRERMMNATPQGTGLFRNDTFGTVPSRYSSTNTNRIESPTLGLQPVRQYLAPQSSLLNTGVARSASQETRRTSIISALSVTELENLGVGPRNRWV